MNSLPRILLIAPALGLSLHLSTQSGFAEVLLAEDFSGGDGGFTQTTSSAPANPWTLHPSNPARQAPRDAGVGEATP